jgi:HSP20 family molecular chaperone IbpA
MNAKNEVTKHQSSVKRSGDTSKGDGETPQRAVLPAVDVFENESGITLMADMPGVGKDQLELRVEGDSLLIEGSMRQMGAQELDALYAEVRVPRFRRSFTLSRELDSQHIEANLKDGVLTLRIPKQAHAKPRRIEVTSG